MQSTRALRQPLPYAALLVATAAVYFIAGRVSLGLAIPPGYATAVWPPSGIALAAALLFGARIWPAVWLGAALVNIAVDSSLVAAALIASGNTLEALAGSAMIRHLVGDPARFQRGEDVLKFIAVCALASAIAATMALVPLWSSHPLSWEQGFRNWWTWWQGDLSGMIVVAPLILSWSAPNTEPWPAEKKLEAAVFGALLVAAALFIMGSNGTEFAALSLTFVALPFIIWGAFRFGQREVSTAIAVICAIAIWYTIQRNDPSSSVAINEWLLMLLSFNGMVVATGLVLVTVVGERARAMQALRMRHDQRPQEMSERAAAAPSLVDKLHRALERDEFVLHYQPKVDLHSRRVTGVEALMRWNSPDLGLVPPMQFIPLLEETGLILEVGRWALRQAARDQQRWAEEGLNVPRVAVNVSPIQLRHRSFLEELQQAVERTTGAPLIDLEITESHIMEDIVATMAKLKQVRALGIGIAIDDFGTGYSSLAYLTKLPVTVLKVDRTFITSMLTDDDAMTLVQTILSLATSLKLRTVAEGVETEQQADMLALLGCNEMQGYLISAPRPPAEMIPLLSPRSDIS